jgi:hypothetical protein
VAHLARGRGSRTGRRVVVPLAEYRAARAGHPVALRRSGGAMPHAGVPGAVSGDAYAGDGSSGDGYAGDAYAGEPEVEYSPGGAATLASPARHVPAAEAPLRLTRRGRLVVRLLGGAGLLLVVAVGVLTGPSALAGPESGRVPVAQRVVLPGETLWGIAGEVAPGADRRETVAQIMELNGLSSAEVTAGTRLSVPAGTP